MFPFVPGWNGNINNPRPSGGKETFWPRDYGGWLAAPISLKQPPCSQWRSPGSCRKRREWSGSRRHAVKLSLLTHPRHGCFERTALLHTAKVTGDPWSAGEHKASESQTVTWVVFRCILPIFGRMRDNPMEDIEAFPAFLMAPFATAPVPVGALALVIKFCFNRVILAERILCR